MRIVVCKSESIPKLISFNVAEAARRTVRACVRVCVCVCVCVRARACVVCLLRVGGRWVCFFLVSFAFLGWCDRLKGTCGEIYPFQLLCLAHPAKTFFPLLQLGLCFFFFHSPAPTFPPFFSPSSSSSPTPTVTHYQVFCWGAGRGWGGGGGGREGAERKGSRQMGILSSVPAARSSDCIIRRKT